MTLYSHRTDAVGPPDPRPMPRRVMGSPLPSNPVQPALPFVPPDAPRLRLMSRFPGADRDAIVSLTHALMEALQGRRPLSQLERWAHPDVVATIEHLRSAGRNAPIAFRSARLQLVAETAAEISIHLVVDAHSRAAAMRLVRVRGRWVCTRFESALWTTSVTKAG